MNDQLTLIEAESDEALLLPDLERRKRYTAAQVEKIEWKLDMILLAIAAQVIPMETIAARAKRGGRIVYLLTCLNGYDQTMGQGLEGAILTKTVPMQWDSLRSATIGNADISHRAGRKASSAERTQ